MKEADTQFEAAADRDRLAGAVRAALFVALITVGSYVVIPLPFSPVPVALQSGFVLLAAISLTPKWALTSVASYLLLGALGLPLFAGGTGGLGHLLGPTGGYLIAYLPAAAVTSLIAGRSLWSKGSATILGTVVIYAVGVPWLALVQNLSAPQAISLGMLPFLPGDILKIVVVTAIGETTHAILPREARN